VNLCQSDILRYSGSDAENGVAGIAGVNIVTTQTNVIPAKAGIQV
jgi:hypothetical protein